MAKNYVLRGNWYHYLRRVPKKVAAYDHRKHVRIALKTRDEKEARKMAAIYDDFIEKYWRDLIKSRRGDEDGVMFRHASALAKAHGFAYKDMAEIVSSPIDEVLSRVEAVENMPRSHRPAFLGAAKAPAIRLIDCVELFWPLCADRLIDKSEHQIRKFKNPRKAAMNNFIGVVGNQQVAELERSHVLQFRHWLMDRIAKGEILGNTANKQMRHMKDVLHTVAINHEIGNDFKLLFSETRLQEETISRPPFEASYVENTLLNGKSLEGLNHDARMLVYIMAETGARESEIIGLDVDLDIFLNDAVPHIWIRKNKWRGLKTKTSERKVPLTGMALLAVRAIAERGIERYRKNPDSASAAINKYFKDNDLKPTSAHTLYSLRHTFKDRLRDVEAPEEIIDELMGHKKSGPKYGRGHLLKTKLQWLEKIAFTPPTSI